MNVGGHIPRIVLYILILLLLIIVWIPTALSAPKIYFTSVQGAIGPATADFIVRTINKAQQADLLIIQIDTPGGLDKSMRQIVQAYLSSKTPVVTFVAPNGARAASAGTFLIYASTIAAMAPGTHLGAASPVSLVGSAADKQNKEKGTMEKKVLNDAVAYIRNLAQMRGRDPRFAEKAVLEAATLTAPEALKAGVIDLIAVDKTELLQKLDGRVVRQNNQNITLHTQNLPTQEINPDWRMRFLLVITDPTIAYLLLLLGIYGIFFELVNPGFVAPGVIGAIAILIALYALQMLPINYAGLGLLLLGLGFIVVEAFTPSFGILGLGGTIAFILGSLFLMDTEHEAYQIAWYAIAGMAAANLALLMVIVSMVVRARNTPVQHGTDTLIGIQGRAIGPIATEGQAMIQGEIWSVYSTKNIPSNSIVKVVRAKGLKLEVEEVQR